MHKFVVQKTKGGHPKRNRSNELLRFQLHSYRHAAFGQCTHLQIDERSLLMCPICTGVKPIECFTEDHAPQRGQTSRRFGPVPWLVVLDCQRCNGGPGRTYESIASLMQKGALATTGTHACEIHGRAPGRFVDLDLAGYTPIGVAESSDLKTAFLIAFAVLGYRWAADPTLDPIRIAIQNGTRVAPQHGSIGRFPTDQRPRERQVAIMSRPQPAVYVVGLDGHGAKFPFFSSADLSKIPAGSSRGQSINWPRINKHQNVADSFTNGQLFVLDHPTAALDMFDYLAA